jgi:hypothetical protein
MERKNIPRRAEEERQCKRAQIQRKTTQRTEHPETYADISTKTHQTNPKKNYSIEKKKKKKKTYIHTEFNKNDHLGFHFQLQKLTETWIWRRRGFPVMTWWATHGCRKDLSLRVTLRYEAITIHATIPHSVAPCHTAMLSISFSLSLSLSL